MAEEIISAVVIKLSCLITQIIRDEIQIQSGLSKELESIKNDLQIITPFLRDAEDRAEQSESLKAWIRQVRDVGYMMEDVMDEHVRLVYAQLHNQFSNRCVRLLLSMLPCTRDMMSHRKLASSIADIKDELLKIQQRQALYNLFPTEQVSQATDTNTSTGRNDPRVGFLYPRDSDLVGIEDPQNEIFELLNMENEDCLFSILSIVGMGGIGKTTLAWKIFENIDVKRHFYVHAWITITQYYNRKDIFKNMLQRFCKSAMEHIPPQVDKMDEFSLVAELRSFLENKRYMVVFDDVWEPELWDYLKNAFPGESKGSKIILTTRHEIVARSWKCSWTNNYMYKLQLLPPKKASDLFFKKAFHSEPYPQWCEEMSKTIVSKCGGLPLALVTVGGLLSTKDTVFSEWKRFCDSLGSELEQNPQLSNISRILLLSYNALPRYLKPCLIYFAMFPEGSSIEWNRLLKLWIAEDFIKEKSGVAIEDVAREHLLELIQRNLVHVSNWYDCGRERTIRVHDLLHETLRQKLEELNFGLVLGLNEENLMVVRSSRRLSVHEGCFGDVVTNLCNTTSKCCNIRSLLVFRVKEISKQSFRSFFNKFHLLKVLDLQAAPIEQIPKEVGHLFLVQYLSLRFTKITTIPKTIGKLVNLLTLDLKGCPVSDLPIEVFGIKRLRHLIIYQNTWHNTLKFWEIQGVCIPQGALSCSESLQKLADVNIATSIGFMDRLGSFKKLKYLAISNIKRENSMILCKSIEQLNCLESLNISVDYESQDPLDLQHITSPPLHIRRIYLIGPLEKFPKWIGKLENLNKLRFRGSKLKEIPFDILQELPNLTMFGINKDVYYGKELVFKGGGFKKLKAMYFNTLLNINSIEIEIGAMPLLEDLKIVRCPQLKAVPLGLQYLKKLTTLRIVEMPEEFIGCISSNSYITKHVADIRVGYQTPSGLHIFKKL